MDKSWIHEPRLSPTYEAGVERFLDFAFGNASGRENRTIICLNRQIKCPCMKCYNVYFQSRDVVYEHLICNGLEMGYFRNIWDLHGELRLQRSSNEMLDGDRHDLSLRPTGDCVVTQPTPEGDNSLTNDEIYDQVNSTKPRYIKGLGHGFRPSSSSTSRKLSREEQAKLETRIQEEARMEQEALKARLREEAKAGQAALVARLREEAKAEHAALVARLREEAKAELAALEARIRDKVRVELRAENSTIEAKLKVMEDMIAQGRL